jgi:hypothetical protein
MCRRPALCSFHCRRPRADHTPPHNTQLIARSLLQGYHSPSPKQIKSNQITTLVIYTTGKRLYFHCSSTPSSQQSKLENRKVQSVQNWPERKVSPIDKQDTNDAKWFHPLRPVDDGGPAVLVPLPSFSIQCRVHGRESRAQSMRRGLGPVVQGRPLLPNSTRNSMLNNSYRWIRLQAIHATFHDGCRSSRTY